MDADHQLEAAMDAVGLTAREKVVARTVAGGGTLQSAAARLFVSRNTVKSQLAAVYRKTGARSRQALAVWIAEAEGR